MILFVLTQVRIENVTYITVALAALLTIKINQSMICELMKEYRWTSM